jgi:hypothetical protein
MSLPLNIVIPQSIFKKMVSLRDSKPSIFRYLYGASKSYFQKNLQCENDVVDVRQIRFTLIKNGKEASEIQMHFVDKTNNPRHIISDESGFLKKRMEQFYKFDSDLDFVTTFLYFFCKYYGLDFNVISDKIYYNKTRIETADVTKRNQNTEILKYIYLDLKPI